MPRPRISAKTVIDRALDGGHISVPLGLAQVGSFDAAHDGDEARLLWSLVCLTSAGRMELSGGVMIAPIFLWRVEQAVGRKLRAGRGAQILRRAIERSTITAPGTRLDGVRLFDDIDIVGRADGSSASVVVHLSQSFAQFDDTLSKAEAKIPLAVWHELARGPAVEMAVRAAAAFAEPEIRVWSREIPLAAMGGQSVGLYVRVHLAKAIEQLNETAGWACWSIQRPRYGATSVTVIADKKSGLNQQLKPGLTPRVRLADIKAARALRRAEITAQMAEDVQREADEIAARYAKPVPVASNDDARIEELRRRRREEEALAEMLDPFNSNK